MARSQPEAALPAADRLAAVGQGQDPDVAVPTAQVVRLGAGIVVALDGPDGLLTSPPRTPSSLLDGGVRA